ncbi:apolipoprotein C-II isoform X1 [Phyllostomus hastatus]|uniref:apolipoprotein C-II isoform X1 n=1 Tax=Phyllostomus hastatus TaxID=9423 RepID=UPI001E683F76|nr:apolipoprotein C-II isoform X1 [Phyllostomus hastatus]XP_045701226.1 apolipoprotein C-II isoform X1 [Phyllostomus hastatus]
MGTRYFLALFLILLVLGFEVQGAPLTQEDEISSPSLFSQMQESLYSYWDTAKTTAQDLYQKTYLPSVDESIRSFLFWRETSNDGTPHTGEEIVQSPATLSLPTTPPLPTS